MIGTGADVASDGRLARMSGLLLIPVFLRVGVAARFRGGRAVVAALVSVVARTRW